MKEAIGETNTKNKQKAKSLFILFSQLTGNNIITTIVYIFFILMETLHFLFLPLHAGSRGDHSFELFVQFVDDINYFKYVEESQGEWFIVAIFCFHAFFVFLILIAAVIISYLGGKVSIKQAKLVYFLSGFLSTSIVLISTALIIPMIESFIYPLLCWQETKHETDAFQLLSCGSVLQISLSVIGSFLLICTVVIFYTFSRVFIDDYWLSTLPWAGENQDIQTIQGIVKVILGLYLALDIHSYYEIYAECVLLFIQCIIVWKRLEVGRPYNNGVYAIRVLQECIVLFMYIYNLLIHTYSEYHSMWAFITLIIIACSVASMIIIKQGEFREECLRKDWAYLKNQSEAENYVRALCITCFDSQGTSEWKFLCSYILGLHIQRCTDEFCDCNKVMGHRRSEKGADIIALRKSSVKLSELLIKSVATEDNQKELQPDEIWLSIIEKIIEEQAIKWSSSRIIKMQLSYFECIILKNYFKSYYWLLNSELLPANHSEHFLAFRMKRILSSWIIMKESKNTGSAQILSLLKFLKVCSTFQKVLCYCTNLIIQFWSLLEMPKMNTTELYTKGEKITTALQWVNETFKKSNELNPDYSYNYFYYGQFLQQVLNNEDEGREWNEKGDDVVKQQRDSWAKHSGEITRSSDTAILVISGNLNSLGIIESANEHIKAQIGFDISDLIDRNVSRIMPRAIGEVHDNLMMHHIKTGKGILLGNERMVFVQTKEGYTEPVCIIANTLPGLENGLEYIGFLRKDLQKIRNHFIKVPSQYKTYKLSYILTDKDRFIIGMSKSACALFGLTTKYIMRKKGISTSPFSISKLSYDLGNDENEHKLEMGTEVVLNVKSILDFLDYDYLRVSEENYVRRVCEEPKRTFVILQNYNYQETIKLKAYVIIDLSPINGSSNAENDDNNANNEANNEAKEDVARSFALKEMNSVSSISSSGSSSQSSASVTNMKKQANMRERPATVRNLIWMIVIFTGIIMTGVTIEFALAFSYSGKMITCETSVILANKILTHFNIGSYKVLAYLNVAHKLEPESLPNISNRTVDLIWETPDFLNKLSKDEFEFEQYTLSSLHEHIRQKTIFQLVNVSVISPNFDIKTEQMTLNNAIYNFILKGNLIMRRTLKEVTTPYYLNNFQKITQSDRLSNLEREMFFLFKNALSVIHEHIKNTGDTVHNECSDKISNDQLVLLLCHIVMYAVCGIFGIMLIPVMFKIQHNKHALLELFSEIPLSSIKTMITNSKKFLKKNLSHLYKVPDDEAIANQKGFKMNSLKKDNDENQTSKIINETKNEKSKLDDETETNKFKEMLRTKPTSSKQLKTQTEDLKIDTEENKNLLDKNTKEIDDIQTTLVSFAEKEREEDFIRNRQQTVKNMPASFNYLTIFLIIVFLVPFAYYAKMLLYIVQEYSNYKELMSGVKIVNDRWAYLSNTLLFYRSYLKSLEHFHYKINGTDAFEYYFEQTIHKEYEISKLKVASGKSAKNIAKLLTETDGPEFCQTLADQKKINGTWCLIIANGLLKEGLTKSASYFLTRTRNKYMQIKNSMDSAELKLQEMLEPEFINLILIFLRIYNPRFDEMSQRLIDEFSSYINTQLNLFAVDFSIFMLISLIVAFILTQYFAKKIEMEIFTSRGIIALLPEKLLKTGTAISIIKMGKQLTE